MSASSSTHVGLVLCVGILGQGILGQMSMRAEEGGAGHYLPGAVSSFADSVPPKEAIAAAYNLVCYDGGASVSRPIPVAGLVTVGLKTTTWAHGLALLWRPPVELGERWSYALSAMVPYVASDVSAELKVGQMAVQRSSSISGLGDVVLVPLMLNYNINPDLNVSFRGGIYAPTGDFEVGRLANTGKNFWTFEPTAGLMYLGVKNGIEASLFLGADFNTENPDTQYQSGSVFHLDGTLAQHIPLAGGFVGLGVNGFWYDQVSGDSGAGARLGAFEGMTTGLGPVLSYARKLGKVDLVAQAKWLREIDTQRRLEGDIFWLRIAVKF